MSWTGSENQRKPQGICLPPKYKPVQSFKFVIPEGTWVEVRRIENAKFFDHRTKKDLGFVRYESRVGIKCCFRYEGWIIRVKWHMMEVNR